MYKWRAVLDKTVHARDESESVHFAHARRHIFARRGPAFHCDGVSKDIPFMLEPENQFAYSLYT